MAKPSFKGDWRSLGGSKREHVNVKTGQIISRRQYDQKFGSLAKAGYKTYESKAKTNLRKNPVLAKAQPARGRKSTLESTRFQQKGSQFKVKGKRKFRDIHIPIHYSDGEPDFSRLRQDYDAVVEGLQKNKRVFGASVNLGYRMGKVEAAANAQPTRTPNSMMPGFMLTDLLETFFEDVYGMVVSRLLFLDLHVIFSSEHFNKIVPLKPILKAG